MSVTAANLVATSATVAADGHVDLVATVEVYTNDGANDLAWTVVNYLAQSTSIPPFWNYGGEHLYDASLQRIGDATLSDIQGTHRKWTVPLSYSTRPIATGGGATCKSPFGTVITGGVGQTRSILDEPWKISGTYVGTTKTVTVDKDGFPIITSGTEEIKALEVPTGYDTLRLEGASDSISLASRAQAVKKCNSHMMWGLDTRQLYLDQWTFEIRRYGATDYVWNSLEFWIRYDRWNEKFWNASKKRLNPDYDATTDSAEQRLIAIVGEDGLPVTEPQLIDPDGVPCTTAEAVEVAFEVIPEFNFLTLGFPLTLPGPFA